MAKREKLIHLRLSGKEEQIIKENAAKLNMEIRPYIRMVAQNPSIINFDYAAIEKHTRQIGQIVNSVNKLIFTIDLNNDYQPKEIEGIRNYIEEIWETENNLLKTVRKQWENAVKQNRK